MQWIYKYCIEGMPKVCWSGYASRQTEHLNNAKNWCTQWTSQTITTYIDKI